MYERISAENTFFPDCISREVSQGFPCEVGKTESCHVKEEDVVGLAIPAIANVQARVKGDIRTYS